MAANRKLRAALLEKRGFTRQRLSQLVQKRKRELPMSSELAMYTIAHESDLDVSKYLTPDETTKVRELMTQLNSAAPPAVASATNGSGTKGRRTAAPKPALVTIGGFGLTHLPGMSAVHGREAEKMAKVYAALYVFENSLRDIIEGVLRREFGDDWWTKGVPPKIQQVHTDRKASEANEPWHGKRGARPIDYLDLLHLAKIIKHKWKSFEKIFPSQAWIESLVTHDMNVSRRPVAHMNPLSDDDIRNIETALRKYASVLKANAAKIP